MKQIYLICICIVWLAGCQPSDKTMHPMDIKIKSVTGVGNIVYEGDLIRSIGKQQFIYNTNKELTGCRMQYRDTVSVVFLPEPAQSIVTETIERYSYLRQGAIVKAELIDSIYSARYINNEMQDRSLLINQPAYEYYHTGNRLDSSITSALSNVPSRVMFEYDVAGNIKKEKTYQVPNYSTYPNVPIIESVTVYEYDNNVNPFKALYDKYGVVIDFYKEKGLQNYWNKVHSNISANNPVRMETAIKIGENTLRINTQIKYEYNAKGLPIKITYETTGQLSRTIDISYY